MIRKGLEFDHPRVINPDGTPMRYFVTSFRQYPSGSGVVYYRPIDGGNVEYTSIEKFKEWLR